MSKKTSAEPKSSNNVSQEATYKPSEKEILNGRKVLSILEQMDDIGYKLLRPDLFTVVEPETGLEITIDAEEDVVCLVAEICDIGHLSQNVQGWQEKLLRLNNMLLHGAFTLHENKVLMRENLAAQNLDPNELIDALSAMFAGILRYGRQLKLA